MPKFILTGVFLLLLGLLIKYPFPILEHEYLIQEYQIIPTESPIEKTPIINNALINIALNAEEKKKIDEEKLKIKEEVVVREIPLNGETLVDNRQTTGTSKQL